MLRVGAITVFAMALWGMIVESSSAEEGTALTESELETLLDELEGTLGTLKTVQVSFVQEKHLAIFRDVVRAEGSLYFSSPDSLRFEITRPFRSVLVARGRSVAQYEFIEGQWEKLRTGGGQVILMVTGQIGAWMRGRFREQNGMYSISAREEDLTHVILTPKDEELARHISRIEIVLSEAHSNIVRLEIHESRGDYTSITFFAHGHNVELPDAIFRTSGPMPSEVEGRTPKSASH